MLERCIGVQALYRDIDSANNLNNLMLLFDGVFYIDKVNNLMMSIYRNLT